MEERRAYDNLDMERMVEAMRRALSPDNETHPLLITRIPLICKDIEGQRRAMETMQVEFKESMAALHKKLDEQFVTQSDFWPVKTAVYGFIGVILLAVAGAIVGLVVMNH